MRTTIDYGIDLGTTNSAIARQRGEKPELIAQPGGAALTLPSVVHVAPDGRAVVGEPAFRMLDADPANTCAEFKRLMGTGEARAFPAAGRSMLPEEMSALVLAELLAWAEARDGERPRTAVVTVPAMFQLPQCEATRRATERAGLVHAPLLQEPIAAAIAHCGTGEVREGYWLVYDLGGGTFDVSLVRSRAGRLQVLDHDGDNHLGGRDFDRALVRKAADVVRAEGRLGEFRRSDPRLAEAHALLKVEAERVRVALSSAERAEFRVAKLATAPGGGEPVGVSFALDRGELEALIGPLVARTTALCKKVLERNRLTAKELNGLVLVGGPTRTPRVVGALREDLGVEARHVMDPMHIVAAGAALFASTQKVPAELAQQRLRAAAGAGGGAERVAVLQLEYEPMTTNRAPLLVGRVEPGGAAPARVRVAREGYDSGWLPLNAQGAFAAELELATGRVNAFRVEAQDAAGQSLGCAPSEFNILHGFSVARPPLPQSVGVMLADESMCWYLRKGAALPARHKNTHTTTTALRRGQSGDAVSVPLMQGESARGSRNKAIGVLRIRAEKIARDLPAGSEVEVTLTVDEASHTTARAYVPLLEQWFDDVAFFQLESKGAEDVSRELDAHKERLKKLEALAVEIEQGEAGGGSGGGGGGNNGNGKGNGNGGGGGGADGHGHGEGADARVREIQALIEEGDRDSIDVAEQLLRTMSTEVDRVFDQSRARDLEAQFAQERDLCASVAQTHGSPPERQQLAALEREFNAALDKNDLDLAEKKFAELRALTTAILWRVPEFWVATFHDMVRAVRANPANAARAEPLINQGERAAAQRDTQALARVCLQLNEMLPREQRTGLAAMGVVSNVK